MQKQEIKRKGLRKRKKEVDGVENVFYGTLNNTVERCESNILSSACPNKADHFRIISFRVKTLFKSLYALPQLSAKIMCVIINSYG